MKELSKLMGYRSDVKVVDATLRDGGLVNNFYFTDEFERSYIRQISGQALIIWNSDIRHLRRCLMKINLESGNFAMMMI